MKSQIVFCLMAVGSSLALAGCVNDEVTMVEKAQRNLAEVREKANQDIAEAQRKLTETIAKTEAKIAEAQGSLEGTEATGTTSGTTMPPAATSSDLCRALEVDGVTDGERQAYTDAGCKAI